ncbi:MAG: S41 family peptidase [Candidatus Brocadiaceae bacterium]|nr:S41 family peptidase [Candidatus Brocadiaceae bacterium]
MMKILVNKCFFLILLFLLNPFTFPHPVFSHQLGNALVRPIQTRMVKYENGYKSTFSYYPVGHTGVYDFSVRVENLTSGVYYKEDLQVHIIDQQGIECVHYRPFLFDKHIYKMRHALNKGLQYSFIIQFKIEDKLQTIEFPFETQEMRFDDLCQWCGMRITNSKTEYFLRLSTGEEKKACCVHCAINYKNKFNDKLASMETLDYVTSARVDGTKAWFVKNSNVTLENSMPPYILAFASINSAKLFRDKCQGNIIDYMELTNEIMEKEDTGLLSADNEEALLIKKLITTIKKNYYREVEETELMKLSTKGIMSSLDKDSSLKIIQPSSLDFIRGFERDETITGVRVIRDAIGYIKIDYFGRRTKEDFFMAMQSMKEKNIKGLIIDLRDNPGGSLKEATQIMQHFVPDGKLLASFQGKDQNTRYFSRAGEKWKRPLVLLVNNHTASSAEAFAATLQRYKKATLVGTNSYGKGTIQKIFPLDYKRSLILTIGRYYLADGITIEESGIQSDYVVEGNNEQMKCAIHLIEQLCSITAKN